MFSLIGDVSLVNVNLENVRFLTKVGNFVALYNYFFHEHQGPNVFSRVAKAFNEYWDQKEKIRSHLKDK